MPSRTEGTPRPDAVLLLLLAVGHAVTDTYALSMLAPMLPEIQARLGLSLGQVGALPLLIGSTASLAQPVYGWITDRYPRLCLVALGPVLAAGALGCVGLAGSFPTLGLLLLTAGLGVGLFHPQGASLARLAGRGSGVAMSAFTVGGNVGFGLAPILGGIYAWLFGMERFYFCAIPALAYACVMVPLFYRRQAAAPVDSRSEGRPTNGDATALWLLTATVIIRSAVQVGMTTFLPFLVQGRFPGTSPRTAAALAVSAFLLASAVAGPLGGWLSDRLGRTRVMLWSFVLAPLPLLVGPSLSDSAMLACLAAGAFLLMLPHPANVVMAQELMPARAGFAASMITGLGFGVAQLLALPLGWLGQQWGVPAALALLSLVPLAGAPWVLLLRARLARGYSSSETRTQARPAPLAS